MENSILLVIDIQNDITKNYKEIVSNINHAVDKACQKKMKIVYIKHNNLSPGARTFLPGTKGTDLVPELKIVSGNIFVKTKSSALTNDDFVQFIKDNQIDTFYITGADATACVKSTCYNLRKSGFEVTVLSDCVTSYDKKKIPEMLEYYKKQGCKLITAQEF